MATYNKFNQFVEDLANAVHNFSTHTFKLALFVPGAPTPPNAADTDVNTTPSPNQLIATSNINEIAAGNGYTEDGETITITTNSQSGGTYTLAANQVVWTAGPAAMANFRYVVLYNISGGAAGTRPAIAWWDYGATVPLNNGETFTAKFNNTNPGTIFTIV